MTSLCRHYLFSQAVASQVFSARMSLTAVFGMGTGGPSPQSAPTYFLLKKKVSKENFYRTFLSLPSSSTISYYILFSKKVNPDFLLSCSAGLTSRAPGGAWCAFRDSNPGPTD